jgi:hypothetical protein
MKTSLQSVSLLLVVFWVYGCHKPATGALSDAVEQPKSVRTEGAAPSPTPVSSASGPAAKEEPLGTARNPDPPARAADLPQARTVPAGRLQDFAWVRAQAKQLAASWNAKAQLFRADLWGAYTKSRFQPAGARLLFVAPQENQAGFEVRFENNTFRGLRYPLEVMAAPQALPEQVLAPEEALRRLWDLAPSVSHDRVYLQLLRPGVEKPLAVQDDQAATSYPLWSVLKQFPVPFRDQEANAPKDHLVWRMAAVRDHDVGPHQAYGTFVSLDAATGAALSPRQPAVGVQIYMQHKLTPPSPIQPFVFPADEIPLDSPAEQVGTFDALAVAQKAESLDLGLRLLVRDGRPDEEVRRAIDKMCAWWARIQKVRQEDAARGLTTLQEAARQEPKDVRRLVALFTRYVDEIDKEKKRVLGSDQIIKLERLNKLSEFWLEKQFEVSPAVLGTRNQTHLVLDTRTGEWIYKMMDPPNTRVFSALYRPAVEVQKAIEALGREDFEFQRQRTRLRWLIGGNGAVVGQEDSLNPVDPLQLMVFAEYNRVRGSEKLRDAAQLRLPKSWSTTSRRDLGGGRVEVTTTTFTRPPNAAELAAADRLEAVALQQDAVRFPQIQDLALKLQPADARIYFLWSRIEAVFYDAQLAEWVAVRGLLTDPGCAELHAARLMAWKENRKVNRAQVYLVEKFSRPYTALDLQSGDALAEQDKQAGYFLSLQRLRVDLDYVGAHAILAGILQLLSGLDINRQEIMPDAMEQAQRELGVACQMMARLLDRPQEWSKGVFTKQPATRENVVKNLVHLLTLRGEYLESLERKAEARGCFQKALALQPAAEGARQGLQRTGR